MRRRVLIGWWCLMAVALLGLTVGSVYLVSEEPPLSVVQVVADGPDLWARTSDRMFLQGVDTEWWISPDGGSTWSHATPSRLVAESAPELVACGPTVCHRLVDGWRIERRSAEEATWEVEHERPRADIPDGTDGYYQDWEERPSIAATDRADRDEAVVAAGRDGVLVRGETGTWRLVEVGESLFIRYLPRVSMLFAVIILLVGIAGTLVIWLILRPARWLARLPSGSTQTSTTSSGTSDRTGPTPQC